MISYELHPAVLRIRELREEAERERLAALAARGRPRRGPQLRSDALAGTVKALTRSTVDAAARRYAAARGER